MLSCFSICSILSEFYSIFHRLSWYLIDSSFSRYSDFTWLSWYLGISRFTFVDCVSRLSRLSRIPWLSRCDWSILLFYWINVRDSLIYLQYNNFLLCLIKYFSILKASVRLHHVLLRSFGQRAFAIHAFQQPPKIKINPKNSTQRVVWLFVFEWWGKSVKKICPCEIASILRGSSECRLD